MNRYAIWAVNTGLFVLCCFLLASVIAEVGAASLAPEPGQSIQPPQATTHPRRSRNDRSIILARNLFNASILKPVAPEPEPDETENLEETKLPLKLLGTASSPDQTLSWAAIEDLDERKHRVVAAGAELRDTVTVVRVERARVVLRNRGKLEELTLDDEPQPTRVAKRRRPTRASVRRNRSSLADRVRKVSDSRFEVDPDTVQEALRNPTTLFSQARILPKYQDGEMLGVQLNAIKEDSLFEKVGLVDGDTITEFNGQSLSTPADSAAFLQDLMGGGAFDVKVLGEDGIEKTLNFDSSQ